MQPPPHRLFIFLGDSVPSFLLQEKMLGKFPDDDAGRDTDVQTVLRAELRDFETAVAHVHDLLQHTFDLVAKDDGIALGHALVAQCGQRLVEML